MGERAEGTCVYIESRAFTPRRGRPAVFPLSDLSSVIVTRGGVFEEIETKREDRKDSSTCRRYSRASDTTHINRIIVAVLRTETELRYYIYIYSVLD